MTDVDRDRLDAALELAHRAIGVSDPNPRVGCVIGNEDGTVIASGFTQRAGGMHAEASAIASAKATGCDLRGATVWVSLEPCAHHGRTPPCCEALIDAGIKRVVIAVRDPFPQVNGAGIERLRAAGIAVDMAEPDIAMRARELNIGFFSRIERGRPWVRLKIAASLDGRTALSNGSSQWITGPQARADGHAWRKRASAVLTGIGTVLADDPRLDVRHVPTAMQPKRIVVDSSFRISVNARVLDPPGFRLVVGAEDRPNKIDELRQHGVDVLLARGADGRVDLGMMLLHLARLDINEVHVEAGETLNTALLRAGLADELIVYLAPKLIGEGHGMVALGDLQSLTNCLNLRFVSVTMAGDDVCVRVRPVQLATELAS